MERIVDGADRDSVHQLQSAGDQARRSDALHRVAGAIGLVEEGQEGGLGRGSRAQPEGRLRHQPQGSLRAHEQVGERVAGHVLDVASTGPDDGAVREDHLQSQD